MKNIPFAYSEESLLNQQASTLDEGMTGCKIRRLLIMRQNEVENRLLREAYSRSKVVEDLHRQGMHDGLQTCCIDLADVLYSIFQAGLGKASVIQESNSHVLIRVQGCAECAAGFTRRGCQYLVGFICGALQSSGKPTNLEVHEKSCGRMTGAECVFVANW